MKPGVESQTSVLVCMGRAAAHGATSVARFSDPTAIKLLPDEARARVERYHANPHPKTLRGKLGRNILQHRGSMMVTRTVAIDDAIRAVSAPQLVILGAGLDGRAWRMAELHDTIVFEVDHPDTQRQKRARAAALSQTAREVRFVPVDFSRDSLEAALSAAGHDATRPTIWVWEGVVMYLHLAEIEATLAVVKRRSAFGSRIIIAYHRPTLISWFVGFYLRRIGEPLRSAFTPEAMRELLARFGFAVKSDEDLLTIGSALASDIGKAMRRLSHLSIVIADRRAQT